MSWFLKRTNALLRHKFQHINLPMQRIDFFFVLLLLVGTFCTLSAQKPASECALPGPDSVYSPIQNPTELVINWTPVPSAQLYQLEVFEEPSGTLVYSEEHNSLSVTVSGLTPGTTYRVEVSATACALKPAWGEPTVIHVPTSIIIVDIIIQRGCSGNMVEQTWQNNAITWYLPSDGSQIEQIEAYIPGAIGGGSFSFLVKPDAQNLAIEPLNSYNWSSHNQGYTFEVIDYNGLALFHLDYINLLNNTTRITVTRSNAKLKLRSGTCAIDDRSEETGQSSGLLNNHLSVAPNPCLNSVNIMAAQPVRQVTVTDLSGKTISQAAPDSTETVLNTSQWKPGVYFLQVKTDTGAQCVKLVKYGVE